MTLSGLSVRRPVLALVIALLVLVAGVAGFLRLPLRELPDVDPPVVSVSTTYRGASAEVVETRITQPLEEELGGIEGIDTLNSSSNDGRSNVTITFRLTRPIDAAANDVRDAVARASRRLPTEADPPQVQKADADSSPVIWLNVYSDRMSPLALTDYARRTLVDRFAALPGVAQIRIGGELRYAMRIWLDARQLAARGLTVGDVERALRSENLELPAGQLETGARDFTIRLARDYKTAADFARLPVRTTATGSVIRLGDIARVEEGPEEIRRMFRGNGQDMIGLGIVRQSQANDLEISRAVRAELENVKKTLPAGMGIMLAIDSADFTRASVHEVWVTLGIAALLVALVNILFLGSWRAAVIPTVVAPISIIGAFAVLAAFGFSINLLTLLALVLAIGLVVDDSIVVTENCVRRVELGEPPLLAADRGARQVFFAVVATTAVLIAGLLPMMLLPGFVGRLFVELAVAIAGAVLISAVLSLSLTPMMASKLLRAHPHTGLAAKLDAGLNTLASSYRDLLQRLVIKPKRMLMVLAVAVLATGVLFNSVKRELVPEEDRGRVDINMTAAEGAGYPVTKREMLKIDAILKPYRDQGLVHRVLLVAPRFGDTRVNSGFVIVSLVDWGQRDRSAQDLAAELQKKLSGITGGRVVASVRGGLQRGPGSGSSEVQYTLVGSDYTALTDAAQAMIGALKSYPGLEKLRLSHEPFAPRLVVRLDRERAAALGVETEAVAAALETLMGSTRVGTYVKGAEEYDVIVQSTATGRDSMADLATVTVRSTSGAMVPLSAVTRTDVQADVSDRKRLDRQRAVSLTGNLTPGTTLGQAIAQIEQVAQDVAPNTAAKWQGTAKDYKEAGSGALVAFAMAMLIVFLVLAAQFESFVHPLVILVSAPLALMGGLAGIYVFGASLNIYSQVGLVILIGIAAKNGVLIVEFANQLRDEGHDVIPAVLEAAHLRLRPILMTSIATAGGALPLMLTHGPGAESRFAIGVALVCGTIVGTILTLVVVPALYALAAPYTRSPQATARALDDLTAV